MFAEELSSNASRKRQQENRARRRQLKTEQEKRAAKTSTASISTAASSTTSTLNSAPVSTAAPPATASSMSALSSPEVAPSGGTTSATGKSAAVANALQQRQLRQESQLQQKASIKIQSFFRSCRSNRDLVDQHTSTLAKRLSDISTLRAMLKEKAPDKPYVPPPATTTALVQQILFVTRAIPYKRRVESGDKVTLEVFRGLNIRNSHEDAARVKALLECTVIPGLQTQDDNLNPFLTWMETPQGRYRLEHLVRLSLHIATTRNVSTECLVVISNFIKSGLGMNRTQPLSSKAQELVPPLFQAWMLSPTMTSLSSEDPKHPIISAAASRKDSSSARSTVVEYYPTMDLIQTLRKFLLFTIGGSHPIPATSADLREECISASERAHGDVLFNIVAEATQSIPEQRVHLEACFLSEILTIPLVTWKILPNSISKILAKATNSSNNNDPKVLLVSMISSFVELNKTALSSGDVGSVLPTVDVPLAHCPATNTQCLLANLIALGRLCPQVNGNDAAQLDYPSAIAFFNFVATLLDDIPLGTFLSRDSAVEWVTDGKGHHTPIILSPVILDQCKLFLVDSFARKLFHCAIDSDVLKTKSVLASKNEKDLKHEKDLKEAGSTAASLAAKEARVDRSKGWLSSKWANKLKKGVSSLLAPAKQGESVRENYEREGQGHLVETTSVSRKLAGGEHDGSSTKAYMSSKEEEAASKGKDKAARKSSSYSPKLLFALCRAYGTILTRWGGVGKEDIVTRKEENRRGGTPERATSRPDPCTMTLLNVLCFGTDIVRATWGLIQSDKEIISDLYAIIEQHKGIPPVRSLTIRPSYINQMGAYGRMQNDGAVLMYIFVASLAHTLIITDDAEIHDMERPLPIHQIRRCIQLLKKLLYCACNVDEGWSSQKSNPFGLALVATSARAMRDLYDRSSRRPLCVPKLWLIDNLMVKEMGRCKSHADYVALLSTPVLRICPFLVSFKRRLKLFERIVTTQRNEIQGVNDANPFNTNPLKPGIPVQIVRGRVLEDGLATLNKLGRNLRERINVQYLNEAGTRESGVDAGGLFKEFWTDLCQIAFNPNYALFKVTEDVQNCLYPNPSSGSAHGRETHIVLFEFLGRILGKALYEGITIHPQFAHFFLSFLRGDYNYFHMLPDLSSVDSQLYNNLMFLKTYDGDAEDLCLTFTVTNNDFGGNKEIPLIPNGANIPVTNHNKQRYIGLVAKYYVVDRVKEQSEAFTRGLWDVIDRSWLRLFNEPELQVLISGATGGAIDVEDMRANTRYIGGYTGIERTITRFWNVVASLSTKQQADLLRFVTSCERPPPLGFASMNPPFTIQRVGIMRDGDRLPTASTCFNTLKLPTYSTEKVLRERLLYSIESGAGFELT